MLSWPLKLSSATFQGYMNETFQRLVHEGHVIIYLDNILIFAQTKEEHDRIVRQVLQILRKE